MKSIACWLLLCCFSISVTAQTETVVTIDLSITLINKTRSVKEEMMQGYFRCYKDYIVERILKIDFTKIKTPADIKPPFYNDTSFYFINTANQRFVEYNAFSDTAKPSVPDDLPAKKLGIKMTDVAALDSAYRLADTTISGIRYIRYRGEKETLNHPGHVSEITGYLLPLPNTSPYSYHKKTEQAAGGRFAWAEIRRTSNPGSYMTVQFNYETRKIPRKDLKIIKSWIARM